MVRAWYKDDVEGDQDEPHMSDPDTLLDIKDLENIGVLYFQVSSAHMSDPETLLDVKNLENIGV